MLAPLDSRETDRLWWRLVRAMCAVSDEIDALKLCSKDVRDSLYGRDCLEHYQGIMAELADLADNDIRRTVTSWNSLLAGTPEEGIPQWHDSRETAPPPPMTWARLAAWMSLARAWRRLSLPR